VFVVPHFDHSDELTAKFCDKYQLTSPVALGESLRLGILEEFLDTILREVTSVLCGKFVD